MSGTWILAAAAVLIGGILYAKSGKKRRPTQHDLDPTLKKNQVRITTAKKAFRRDEVDPEFLARLERRDIVEIPMGQPFPSTAASPAAVIQKDQQNDWLPDNMQPPSKAKGKRKQR